MATVMISGGTGMIGTRLRDALLNRGDEVIILTRPGSSNEQKNKRSHPALQYANWDIRKKVIDEAAFARADAIIHLAGANLAEKRWTRKRKQEILDSRVNTAALIHTYLAQKPNKVRVVVSASAIGWYGPDPVIPNTRPFRETDPPASDFLATVCRKWEAAASAMETDRCRVVRVRTGVVLSAKGGALEEFFKALKFRVATVLGNGKQVMSWIHIDDLVKLYILAIDNPSMAGPYNAVAPGHISNRDFVGMLAKTNGKPFIPLKVPSFVLKTVLGEMSIEVLKSATVSAEKIMENAFHHSYPDVVSALEQVMDERKS